MERRNNSLANTPDVVSVAAKVNVLGTHWSTANATMYWDGHTYQTCPVSSSSVNLSSSEAFRLARTDEWSEVRCIHNQGMRNPYSEYLGYLFLGRSVFPLPRHHP
jgi:hypothetical protein